MYTSRGRSGIDRGRCSSLRRTLNFASLASLESRPVWTVEIAVVGAMVALNAIFAAYEIALASVTDSRLQSLAAEGRRGAATAHAMKGDMERSLAVVQLGITLVGVIAAATSGAGAGEDLAPLFQRIGLSEGLAEFVALVVIVIPLTALTIVIGELVPKLFALKNKEWVCLKLSPAMHWFAISAWPAVWLLEHSASAVIRLSDKVWRPKLHSDFRTEAAEIQELRAIASLARASRLIGAREESIILGAARLSSRPVSEILLPAEHISLLNVNDSIMDCLIAAHLDMHTRFPVTERAGDPQAIIGYVTFKDIVAFMKLNPHDHSLRAIVRGILSLPADLPISGVLERLMREHTHIALLRHATGRVEGMITLEDIIEELIGDIQDEYDLLPVHAVRSGDGWVVGGGISLPRLRELTGLDLSNSLPTVDGPVHNLSGWIIGHLGRIPTGGEVVKEGGIRALVRKVRRQRVLEAQLHLSPRSAAVSSPSP